MHLRCFSLWGVCFGIFNSANPIVATYGYLQLPCIISFICWIIHRSHPWHCKVLWLFNPNSFAQIASNLFTNFMNRCSFTFENNTGRASCNWNLCYTPKSVKSHIPLLWGSKQIHFIGTIKCFISKQTCTDVNVWEDLNERFIFNFTKPFLIHHWFVPWMNRKGHNQFRMLHLFIYISSFQYQTPKWCDWYLLYFERGSTRVWDGEKMCCYGATKPQYFLIWRFINTSNQSVI